MLMKAQSEHLNIPTPIYKVGKAEHPNNERWEWLDVSSLQRWLASGLKNQNSWLRDVAFLFWLMGVSS